MRVGVSAAACLLPALGLSAPFSESSPHPKAARELTPAQFEAALHRIDRETRSLMDRYRVPGVMMTIVKGDKVAWLKGYGYRNLEKKLPVTPDTLFQIASCSKAFTSATVLMQVQDGKLSLDDPVRKYIPRFKLKDPQADRSMTVADLMDHSSGLPRTDLGWITEQLDTNDCIDLMGRCEPTFGFRENAQYSNILVGTAAEVAARAAGEAWPDLVRHRIFEPLHMDETTTADPASIGGDRMAIGYWFDPVTGQVERERYLDTPYIAGAGAIKSSARDLANWLRFHLAGGTFEGKQLLKPEILAEAYLPRQPLGDTAGFGFGWLNVSTYPVTVLEHTGGLPGFATMVCLVPEKHLGIAYSANGNGAILSPLLDRILAEFVGTPDLKWTQRRLDEQGLYVDASGGHLLRVFPSSGALWMVLDQGSAIRLTRKDWRTYETAGPRYPPYARNPHYAVRFRDDATSRSRKDPEVQLATEGQYLLLRRKTPFDPGTTVDALMRKTVDAMGGPKNLAQPLSVAGRYHSVLRQEGLESEGLLVRSNNDLGYMERLYFGDRYIGTTLSGESGDGGGSTQTNYRFDPLLGSDLTDAQIDGQLCQALNWRSTFSSARIVARQTLDGEPVLVLQKTPKGSPNEVIDFVSERTGLVLRREVGNPATVTLFSDYRPVGGVMLPYKISLIDNTFHREDIEVASYDPINHYPHWAFNPIGSAKTPG